MTIFACFGPMFSTSYLLMILGAALGIEAILISGIAFVISKLFRLRMRKILGLAAVTLLACGAFSIPMGWEVPAALTLWSAAVCGLLLVLGWLINLIRGERNVNEEEDRYSLILDAR